MAESSRGVIKTDAMHSGHHYTSNFAQCILRIMWGRIQMQKKTPKRAFIDDYTFNAYMNYTYYDFDYCFVPLYCG